jgi:hypothetical protein
MGTFSIAKNIGFRQVRPAPAAIEFESKSRSAAGER